jgi:hypothetical protein
VFVYAITFDALRIGPAWIDAEPFPPMSPRRAMDLSLLEVNRLFGPCKPRFGSIELRHCLGDERRWYYLVVWMVHEPDSSDPASFSVPVLFSGEVPTPTVVPEEGFTEYLRNN